MEKEILENKSYLKEMVDTFSKATGLNVAAVNVYGEVFLASQDYESEAFCQYIKSSPQGREQCQRTYCKACKEAFRWKEPYFFTCHAGLVMWAVPIVIDGVKVGAVMCGQVLLWQADEFFLDDLKKFHRDATQESIDYLNTQARRLKVISADKCQSAANLLSTMVNYMAHSYDADFMEQRNRVEWQNRMISRIEERQKTYKGDTFDLAVYLKRERRYLQYLRMGDKDKVIRMLPLLFTDIEILNSYELSPIRGMFLDLMALSSRAIVEAGADSETVLSLAGKYRDQIKTLGSAEEINELTFKVISQQLDAIYLLASNRYISVLKEVKKYVDVHYAEKITMEDVAAHVFMSKSYLCTLFKEKMNISIHDYLLRVRIEKSIELMQNRELSIREIMKQCGFESQSYYTKAFRKLIGITPGQYRNQFL